MCVQEKQNLGAWNTSELMAQWQVGFWHSVGATASIYRNEQPVAGAA
jgi:hypothetical protein